MRGEEWIFFLLFYIYIYRALYSTARSCCFGFCGARRVVAFLRPSDCFFLVVVVGVSVWHGMAERERERLVEGYG